LSNSNRYWGTRRLWLCACATFLLPLIPTVAVLESWELTYNRVLGRLAIPSSPDETRALICRVQRLPARRRVLQKVFAMWGTKSESYDLAVLSIIRGLSPHGLWVIDDEVLRPFCEALRRDPSLALQLLWNEEWQSNQRLRRAPAACALGQPEPQVDNENVPARFARELSDGRFSTVGRELVYLLRIAGLRGDAVVAMDISFETLHDRLRAEVERLRADAPFMRWCETRRCYVIEESARRAGRVIPDNARRRTAPGTSLPPRNGGRK